MQFQTIKFERRDSIGVITLNRPEKLNAISYQMRDELRDFFEEIANDLKTRVILLRAEGLVFCAGTDLENFETIKRTQGDLGQVQHYYRSQQVVADLILRMRNAPQPIVAAVQGPAAGAGFAMSLACDARIAGEDARFNAAFIRIGLSACDMGVSYLLPKLVGLSVASEYMFTGRFMDAAAAVKCGLVSRVVPTSQVESAAMDLANEMAQHAPLALRLTKETLNLNIGAQSLEQALKVENRGQTLCTQTEDAKEGPRAFLEKRKPVYRDR